MAVLNLHVSATRPFIIVFLVSCALLAGFTYTLYSQSADYEKMNAWTIHSYEVIRQARRTVVYVLDIETGHRGYLLTRSKEFLGPYNEGMRRLDENIAKLDEMTKGNPDRWRQVQDIHGRIDVWKAALSEQVERFEKGGRAPVTIRDLQQTRLLMESIRDAFDDLLSAEDVLLRERYDVANREQRKYFMTLLAGAVLTIGGLLVANLLIVGLMAKTRQTEEALQDAQKTYSMLMDNLNDGIYDFYPSTGLIIFSDSYAHMLGYSPGELKADKETMASLLHPDDKEQALATLDQYMRKELPSYINTYRMQHRNGSWRWILSRGIGQWDSQGNMTRMLGMHTDITEQKQREEDTRQLTGDLESFIYIVSHDLRSPLVNLKGFAKEVEHVLGETMPVLKPMLNALPADTRESVEQALEKDVPEALGFIRSSVQRMDALTTAILDLSRIGRRELKREEVDTSVIVKRCLDSMAYEINAKNVEVVCGDLPVIVGDAVALEQIFGNIIDNAVKYLREDAKGIIAVRAKQLPWETIFSVQDNGRGIAEHDKKKVFDFFRRASNSGNVRGAGMGMAYIKALLRRFGGRIWFESELDQGTTFYFSVPVVPLNATQGSKEKT